MFFGRGVLLSSCLGVLVVLVLVLLSCGLGLVVLLSCCLVLVFVLSSSSLLFLDVLLSFCRVILSRSCCYLVLLLCSSLGLVVL